MSDLHRELDKNQQVIFEKNIFVEYPFISIIVGIRNEERYIENCINSLLNLNYPKERYDIIIVDGMSEDDTLNILSKFPVSVLINQKKNVAAARNIGVNTAKGDYVAFTDGDCVVDPDWLKILVKEIINADNDIAGVGGPNLVFDDDPCFARFVGYTQETFLGSGGSPQSHAYKKKKFVYSISNSNSLYKKRAIIGAGFYDERFIVGQDGELNYRIKKLGGKFIFIPEAKVWHHRRATLLKFSKWMYNYGAWMTEFSYKNKSIVRWYSLLPPLAIVLTAIFLVLSKWYPVFLFIWLTLVFIYFVLEILTAIKVFRKTKSINAILVFPILIIQHTMYGFGVLHRLVTITKNHFISSL